LHRPKVNKTLQNSYDNFVGKEYFYGFVILLTAKDILNGIIRKGGLMGAAAKMYINDEEKTNQFIKECSEQCHNKSAREFWGEELIKEIMEYSKNKHTKKLTLIVIIIFVTFI